MVKKVEFKMKWKKILFAKNYYRFIETLTISLPLNQYFQLSIYSRKKGEKTKQLYIFKECIAMQDHEYEQSLEQK